MTGQQATGTLLPSRRPRANAALALVLSLSFVTTACGQFEEAKERAPGAVLLEVSPNATKEARARFADTARSYGLQVESELLDGSVLRLQADAKSFGREEEMAKALVESGAATFAEPDYAVPLAVSPNDPMFGSQWHHARIHSTTAWAYTTGSFAVRAAVCDAGFDVNHPDLRPNLSLPGYDVVTGGTAMAGNSHGTMTAGTLAARGNNGYGVSGVAWNVTLMPIKVSETADGSSSYSALANCIQYASSRGAKVISISFGGIYASSTVNSAAAYARNRGSVVVIAAGNERTNISGYANSGNYLMVGATDSSNRLASFSNYGTPVDLVAPGVGITTTSPGSSFATVDGTSFATPIVAGVAALIYSLNPNFTPLQVETFIVTSAQRLSPTTTFGWGVVDAGAAMAKARASL